MEILLQHKFYTWCPDKPALFSGMFSKNTGEFIPNACKISTYMRAVCKQADLPQNSLRWEPSKFVGDGFEIFVEALIKTMGLHPDIGITDYVPHTTVDNGVDGVGKGILDLRTVTVQAKYRPREDTLLAAGKDRLDSFFAESVGKKFRIKLEWDDQDRLIGQRPMLVVTTAKDLNAYTRDEKFNGVMRCIGASWLHNNIDGNTAFWKQFRDLMI